MLAGLLLGMGVAAAAAAGPPAAGPPAAARPWLEPTRSPEERAALALAAMTLEEKLSVVQGSLGVAWTRPDGVVVPAPAGALASAGYVPGVPRLGITPLYETDASLGVANPQGVRPGDGATALPASLALAASFDPDLAFRAGAVVGNEARLKGFNVLLGGGMNLTRDPRNGRNFEYLGEDPLLAGRLAGEAVRGTQSQHVISTLKHFALNANETNRVTLDARIDRAALRESDLLAFELAVERGHPGAVMCSYNLVNGEYACGNRWLLETVLKRDWHYPGWVMSDWGAVHAVTYAMAGLDQESGAPLDSQVFFGAPLAAAVASGTVPRTRIDDMARRILRAEFAVGIQDPGAPGSGAIDYAAHAAVALDIARQGAVLLKNSGPVLPLAPGVATLAVIGGHADVGVPSGGGSAQVLPANGAAIHEDDAIYDPSPPLTALRHALPGCRISYDAGAFPARAAALAAHAEVAIVFATRHESEGVDIPDLDLPYGQNGLIEAVARANPRTIVVLEAGNPVAMPWLERVPAVLAAWYPGEEGGQAIADILTGAVNPSGRLPITFPVHAGDFLRPTLPNLGAPPGAAVHVDYREGAEAGYRWYGMQGVAPLFSFGHGLSYTRFEYGAARVTGDAGLTVSVEVRNAGPRSGAEVVQSYLTLAAGRPVLRLVGFERVFLEPGARRLVTLGADPRLLGEFDEQHGRWHVARGRYEVRIGRSVGDWVAGGETVIAGNREIAASWQPAR